MRTQCSNKVYLVLCVLLSCLVFTPARGQSLVAEYQLNAGSGSTATDSSGYGNNGTIYGASWVQLPGDSSYCLSFDGTNDYIDCGSGASLNLTSAVTMVAWVCPSITQFSTEPGICGKAWSRYLMTYYGNSTAYFYINWGSGGPYTYATVPNGIWSQVAVTYNGSTLKVYVNGVLQDQYGYSGSITSGGNFYIGLNGSNSNCFKGLIDEVKVYNSALSATQISDLYSSSTRDSKNAMFATGGEDSLVAHYNCNEGSGTTINDCSGFMNTGTASNVTWSANSSPNWGHSLSFNGTNSRVDCGTKNGLDINGPITVMAWINPSSSISGEVGIAGKGFSKYQLTYYKTNGYAYWYINWGGGGTYVAAQVSQDAWSHVAATYDKNYLTIYVNGSYVTQTAYTGDISSGSNLYIGSIGASQYFNGLIDEVRVYNRALSGPEISARYTEDSISRSSGLVAHYPLNQNTGSMILDASGHGNTGTASNCTWADGPAGTALYFDGTQSYVDCGNGPSLDITGPITMVAWMRPEACQASSTTDRGIMGKDFSSYLLTYYANDYSCFYIDLGSGGNYTYANPAPPSVWTRVAATFDGTDLNIYQNGVLANQATSNSSTINQGYNFFLGCIGLSGGSPVTPFAGHLSDVKIYNRALSSTEISTDYESSAMPTVRLNSLVSELVNKNSIADGTYSWNYSVPFDTWVFFSSNATLSSGSLTVSDIFNSQTTTVITQSATGTQEAFWFLEAGTHQVEVSVPSGGSLDRLALRTVPELMYAQYPGTSMVTNYGPYDWDYLETYVLGNVNCLITDDSSFGDAHFSDWHSSGKRIVQASSLDDPPSYSYWWGQPGYQNSLGDGIIVDLFYDATDSRYTGWSTDLTNIYNNEGAAGKVFYAYWGGGRPWTDEPAHTFARNIMNHGGAIAVQYYTEEKLDAATADYYFAPLKTDLAEYKDADPGAHRHFIPVIGYMSAPNESLNVNPDVDFKVHLDRYINLLGTDSTFQDLYGISMYLAGYADEEAVRWASKLYRHYGIEGNKSFLSDSYGYTYNVGYCKNPDFYDGTNDWSLYPSGYSSISSGTMTDFGWLQGRYPYSTGRGDTYLWTQRTSNAPNYIEQVLTGLTVGQWYSIKMFCADYQDMLNGVSASKDLNVSLYVYSGGTVDSSKTFHEIVGSNYAHTARGFDRYNPAYMNYFSLIFQATSTTAGIGIMDWPTAEGPGGPVGQQIMYNFIEVQPYLYD